MQPTGKKTKPESIIRMTDYTMTKRKEKRTNNDPQSTSQKTKD
jgi:hypothetical protein